MTAITTRRSERIPWDDRLATVHRQYPSTAERGQGWEEALRDFDLMGGVIRDMLKIESAPKRRGQRPSLDIAASEARMRQLLGGDFTVLPFGQALRVLGGALTRKALGDRTAMSASTVQRLIDGDIEPTGAEMERVGAAFGKPPTYFREYRTGLVCAFLADYFADNPEASVALAQRLRKR